MNARLWIGIATVALTLVAGAGAMPMSTAGALQLDATLGASWRFSDSYCAPGTHPDTECVGFRGLADIPGLGHVTETYVKTLESNGCSVTQFRVLVLEIAGKGAINLTLDGGPHCGPPAPAEVGPYTLRISGGSGVYAGASGTLQWRSSVYSGNPTCQCGAARDTLTGTITVPGLEFDLTPPSLSGSVSKTVRARKGAKRARVVYGVKALDAVDGSVPVSCVPRAGSYFKLGRTRVRCSATDLSGNTQRAQFTVTVRRR